MLQEVIAITIVVFTALYAIYKIYKSLTSKSKSACGDCSCGSKKDILKQIDSKKTSALHIKPYPVNKAPQNTRFSPRFTP